MDQILHMDPSPHTDQTSHMDQIHQKDQRPHMNIIVLTLLFCRESQKAMNMCIILQIIMFINPRRISSYPNPSYVKRSGLASMPPFSYGARRMMNSLPPLQMWVVKKKN